MKVEISPLLKANGNIMEFQLSSHPNSLKDLPDDITFLNEIQLNGKLSNLSGILYFAGTLAFSYHVPCARCLEEVERSYQIPVEGDFYSLDAPEKEDYVYSGREIDLSRFVLDNIALTIPFKHLCSDDCKGLCLQCGADLKKGECNCKDEIIDPRLSKLKDLLK